MTDATHDELVRRAVRWLRSTARCGFAVPELVTWLQEQPDAIGWRSNGRQVLLVECKTSRADFLADQRKTFRAVTGLGLGHFRYYLTPKGLLSPEELPARWGLLECWGRVIRVRKEAERFEDDECRPYGHAELMYSLLRRVEVRGLLKPCLAPKWGGTSPSAAAQS